MGAAFVNNDELLGREVVPIRGLRNQLVGGKETVLEPFRGHATEFEAPRPEMLGQRNYRHRLSPRPVSVPTVILGVGFEGGKFPHSRGTDTGDIFGFGLV
jgi:hypothetical protein